MVTILWYAHEMLINIFNIPTLLVSAFWDRKQLTVSVHIDQFTLSLRMRQLLILSNLTSHIYLTWGPYTILILKSCVAYFSPQWGTSTHSYQGPRYLEIISPFSRWQMHRKCTFEMAIIFFRGMPGINKYGGQCQMIIAFHKILRIVTRISVGIPWSLSFWNITALS